MFLEAAGSQLPSAQDDPQRWCMLGMLVLNPSKGLLTNFLLKGFLSWDFCGNQTQKALHGLCVRF